MTVVVLFGSSGHLATTELIPAIDRLRRRGPFRGAKVIGVDRRRPRAATPSWFVFVRGDLARRETYRALKKALGKLEPPGGANVLFYLATGPRLHPRVAAGLREEGLNAGGPGWRRIAVEKPLGVDSASFRELEEELRSGFGGAVFRVDHFLVKRVAAKPSAAGHGDAWEPGRVDSVQIMADERAGVEGRGEFYDAVGVARDMLQNHLAQLLCAVAAGTQGPRGTDGARERRAQVLEAARLAPGGAVWGQYRGYARVKDVRRGSRTPTFVALKLAVENRRWRGVPFYVRTGRRLARDATEAAVLFRDGREPVVFRVGAAGQNEYQRVLLAAARGDQGPFADRRFNELSWRLFDPLIGSQEAGENGPEAYDPGTWGPAASDELVAADGRRWLDGRG